MPILESKLNPRSADFQLNAENAQHRGRFA